MRCLNSSITHRHAIFILGLDLGLCLGWGLIYQPLCYFAREDQSGCSFPGSMVRGSILLRLLFRSSHLGHLNPRRIMSLFLPTSVSGNFLLNRKILIPSMKTAIATRAITIASSWIIPNANIISQIYMKI